MSRFIDQKYYGPEPKPLTELLPSNAAVYSNAFTWYNSTCDDDLKKEWLIQWMEADGYGKAEIASVMKTKHIPNASMAIARMLLNGWVLPPSFVTNLKTKIASWTKVEEEPTLAPVLSIQDRIREKKQQVIGDIEVALDHLAFYDDPDLNDLIKPYDYFVQNEISQVIANAVSEYYSKLQTELLAVNSDKELKEAYKNIPKKQLKKTLEYVTLIVEDAARWADNKKKITSRKPRKKKVKSADQLVNKLSYQKEFAELKLVSIDPATIINASSLWTYNTKTRQLTVYNAIDGGLRVKGTTIKNFNEMASIRKTLRKPSETINNVLNGGKVVLRNLMDTLSTTQLAMNGRINDQTILLRVIK